MRTTRSLGRRDLPLLLASAALLSCRSRGEEELARTPPAGASGAIERTTDATGPASALRSWNPRSAFLGDLAEFMRQVDAARIPPAARTAVFDHDGTLMVERPAPVQIGARRAARVYDPDLLHPRFRVRYAELAYRPMRELIRHFQANDFTCHIVTGSHQEFIQAFSERLYGIESRNVIGEKGVRVSRDRRELRLFDIATGPRKRQLLEERGIKPLAAFGNSDGDLEMLAYTLTHGGEGPRLAALVKHDDAVREYDYEVDRSFKPWSGRLSARTVVALERLPRPRFVLISMKSDWSDPF